jgi:putative component of membrane protein insertase Oxa1/YidC/SpoIIIJ protein YidD
MALGSLAVALIGGYQRYLSPLKGYSCAHRMRHGGASCSEYARLIFASEGMRAGMRKVRRRLRQCHVVGRSLKARGLTSRNLDESFDAPPMGDGKSPTKGEARLPFRERLSKLIGVGCSECCSAFCGHGQVSCDG